MLIPFDELVKKYNLSINGLLHVGAHECEELNVYEKYIARENILWVEALEDKVINLKNKYENINIEQAIVSDIEEEVTFNVSNNGQSSSIFEFGLHEKYHPNVHYINTLISKTQCLKDILKKYPTIPFNFINLDIQGAELKALRGMEEYLNKIDYIYTEVNSDYVYKGCALVTDLDEYLKLFGFNRVDTVWTEYKWGDAFYIKQK